MANNVFQINEGSDLMTMVITFGQEEVSITKIKIKKSVVAAESIVRFRSRTNLLDTVEGISDFLGVVIDKYPELKDEECYVNLSYGCGIQYKTFSMVADDVKLNPKASYEQNELDVLELCGSYVPATLQGNYVTSVMNTYHGATEVIVNCAFFPEKHLGNLRTAFTNAGIALMDVRPLVANIFNILEFDRMGQYVLDLPAETVLYNQFGFIVWPKPKGNRFNSSLISNYLIKEAAELYPINLQLVNTEYLNEETIRSFVINKVRVNSVDKIDAYAASGIFVGRNAKSKENGGKGDDDGAAGRIWKLFHKT